MTERTEALMRILVAIISGIVLSLWRALIKIIVIVHWFAVIITGKRNKDLGDFSEIWNTQAYIFLRYMTFVSNKRPFPFNPLDKSLSKFGK